MTFEEANDRYLDILKRISYIENSAYKDNMYNLAYLTIGLRLCNGKLEEKTEAEIIQIDKMLSKAQ